MFRRISLIAATAMVMSAGSALADENLEFNIKNTSDYIISAFQSNEGSGWSKNWLDGDQVDAGETQALHFLNDGPCDVQGRVSWRTTDGGQEVGDPWNIDICKAHTVYFDGKQVTYD